MRELAIARKQTADEMGRTRTYDYALLVGEMPVSDGLFCESYGVCIREQGGEEERLPHITASAARIDELVDLLVRNTVTPCTLREVVDDWL